MLATNFILLAEGGTFWVIILIAMALMSIWRKVTKSEQTQEEKRQQRLAQIARESRQRRQMQLQGQSPPPGQPSASGRQGMSNAPRQRQQTPLPYQPVKPPPLSPARPAARVPQRPPMPAQRPPGQRPPGIANREPIKPSARPGDALSSRHILPQGGQESEARTAQGVQDEVRHMREQLDEEQRQRSLRLHQVEQREQLVGPGVAEQLHQAEQREQLSSLGGQAAAEDRRDPGIRVNLQDRNLAMRAIILAEILSRPKALRMEPESWER